MKIHGKEYMEVKDRVQEFHKKYPNGSIQTKILTNENGVVIMQAMVCPDLEKSERYFTGHATEWQNDPKSMVNKTSHIENCETSAIGRALAFCGIGIVEGIASADEVVVAQNKAKITPSQVRKATEKQVNYAKKLAGGLLSQLEKKYGKFEEMSASNMSALIDRLMKDKEETPAQVPTDEQNEMEEYMASLDKEIA